MSPPKIKICIVIPGFKCGGSERFISILCNNINTSVFDVELYVLDGEDPFYQITNPGVKVFLLKIKNVRKSLFSLLKIIKKQRPDILFTVSNHLNIYIAIFKFLFPRKIKVIARETSIVSINNKRSKYGGLYEWIVTRFYKNIDYIICQSVYMQNDLVVNYKIKKKNTVVIHNPVEDFMIPINKNLVQNKKSAYKFFAVARLSPEKGINRLIRALALVNLDFMFHIIGEGPEKSNLERLTIRLNIQHKIIFEGAKSNPYENMQDADLFLIGSYFEGFPNVLLEAGMLGIPVVGFNAPGGIGEIIEEGITGFLVNDDDDTGESFKNTVIAALNYNFNRQQIIEIIKSRFAVSKIMKQLENCFSQIYHNHFENVD